MEGCCTPTKVAPHINSPEEGPRALGGTLIAPQIRIAQFEEGDAYPDATVINYGYVM